MPKPNYSIRTDLSSQLEWLSNRFNVYSKFYIHRKENSQSYLRPTKIPDSEIKRVIKSGDVLELTEYFFALTDTYRYPVNKLNLSKNRRRFLENIRRATLLYERLPITVRKEYGAARLTVFLLALTPYTKKSLIRNAEQCISEVSDRKVRTELTKELKQLKKGKRIYEITSEKAHKNSRRNLKKLIKTLISDGLLGSYPKIKLKRTNYEVAIFVPLTALESIVRNGRLKSAWEVVVSRYPGYYSIRDYAEREIGVRGMGSLNHPHPIYGLLLTEADKLYKNTYYGEIKLILKKSIFSRTTFTFGDTFEPYRSNLLGIEEALTASALRKNLNTKSASKVMYITGGKEIEAQILGGLWIDDIDKIEIPSTNKTSERLKRQLRAQKISIKKLGW